MTALSDAIDIRVAVDADVPGIVAVLADDGVGGHGHSTDADGMPGYRAAFEAVSASPVDTLYVAELDGRVIGTFQTTLSTQMSRHARPDMTVSAVFVASVMRGQGVGAAMMRFAIAEARRLGCGRVQLSSNAKRVDAHRFYERLGFAMSHVAFKLRLD